METLSELKSDLTGPLCGNPLNITKLHLFSDSMVVLHWIKSYTLNLDKMNKQPVFILNRLEKIRDLCDRNSKHFEFVDGISNPADFVTRPCFL